jgi:hypothetical protein
LVERRYRFHNPVSRLAAHHVQLFLTESCMESISAAKTDCENGQRADIKRKIQPVLHSTFGSVQDDKLL